MKKIALSAALAIILSGNAHALSAAYSNHQAQTRAGQTVVSDSPATNAPLHRHHHRRHRRR